MQLNVLPVRHVGYVAAELRRDRRNGAQLGVGHPPTRDPDPQHEVLVIELFRLEDRGLAAVDAGTALGVEPPPAEPAAQVGAINAREAPYRVDVLDPLAHVEAVVVLLRPLVGIERLEVAERPLALADSAARWTRGRHGTGRPFRNRRTRTAVS